MGKIKHVVSHCIEHRECTWSDKLRGLEGLTECSLASTDITNSHVLVDTFIYIQFVV